MNNIKCQLCQREFESNRHFKSHIVRTHKKDFENKYEIELFYLREAFNIAKSEVEEICKDYIEGYSYLDLKEKYGFDAHCLIISSGIKIRTNSESKKTKIYIEKYKSSILKKYGVNNVSKAKEIKKQKETTFLEHFGYKNNFGNKEIHEKAKETINKRPEKRKQYLKEKYIKTCIKRYGVDNVAKFVDTRNKISKSQKYNYSKISKEDRKLLMKFPREALIKSCNICRSKIEMRVENIIKQNNIKFKVGGIIQYRSFDFIFEENKVVLEIQGNYFHANPLYYKCDDYFVMYKLTAQQIWDHDLKKKLIAEKHKYRVYYLWEDQIHRMKDNEILEFINNILER